ncbi:MAG TPA: hypothetical protein VEL07_07420 [Planctomycetota bacterium]|nr:hypothetical protein [Planctomycetota bacterium]
MTITGLSTALARTVVLLEAMAGADGLAFGDASAALKAVPSTTSRLLRALGDADLVRHGDDGRYRVSARFRRVATTVCAVGDPAAESAACAEALAAATGESAAVFAPVDDGIRLVATSEPPERFHYMKVGGVNRGCDRHGFCVLRAAWWDEATARRMLADAAPGAPVAAWLRRLRALRREGRIATDADDQPGIGRVAAAVVDGDDRLIAIVGITATAAIVGERRDALFAEIGSAARRLGARLGGRS